MEDAIVVDVGATETRAGFAGDEGPAEVLPAAAGTTTMDRIKAALEALEVEPADHSLAQPGRRPRNRTVPTTATTHLLLLLLRRRRGPPPIRPTVHRRRRAAAASR